MAFYDEENQILASHHIMDFCYDSVDAESLVPRFILAYALNVDYDNDGGDINCMPNAIYANDVISELK